MEETLEEKVERLERENLALKNILKKVFPEKSGHYFITGEGGPKDSDGLPHRIFICPVYGVDWFVVYEKTDITVGVEY